MSSASTASSRGRDRAATDARVPASIAEALLALRLADGPGADGQPASCPTAADPRDNHPAALAAQASRRRALTMLHPPKSALASPSRSDTCDRDYHDDPRPRACPPSNPCFDADSVARHLNQPASTDHSPEPTSSDADSVAPDPAPATVPGAAGPGRLDLRLDGRRSSLIGPILERPANVTASSSLPRANLDSQQYPRTRSETVGAFRTGHSPLATPAFHSSWAPKSRHHHGEEHQHSSSPPYSDLSPAGANNPPSDLALLDERGSGLVRASVPPFGPHGLASPKPPGSPLYTTTESLKRHNMRSIPTVSSSSSAQAMPGPTSMKRSDPTRYLETTTRRPALSHTVQPPPRAGSLPSALPALPAGYYTHPHAPSLTSTFLPSMRNSVPITGVATYVHASPPVAVAHSLVHTGLPYTSSHRRLAWGSMVPVGRIETDRSSARLFGRRPSGEGPPPSRALWIGSLPKRLTNGALHTLFRQWGPLEGTRVLSLKQCAFVNYVSLADATMAREQLSGTTWDFWDRRVGLGLGLDVLDTQDAAEAGQQIKVAYAKAAITTPGFIGEAVSEDTRDGEPTATMIPRRNMSLSCLPAGNAYSAAARERNMAHGLASASNSIVLSSDQGGIALPPHLMHYCSVEEQRGMLAQLGSLEDTSPLDELPLELAHDPDRPRRFSSILPAPPAGRHFDAGKLRNLRRRLEATASAGCRTPLRVPGHGGAVMSHGEVEEYAHAFVASANLPALASDFHGNVIIQKLFEMASEPTKAAMLASLAPHLAHMGCHKNGTWVAQKILECIDPVASMKPTTVGTSTSPHAHASARQLTMAVEAIAPYIPPLLLDQYGNYVVQGLLRFGAPYTNAIFGAFLEQTWEIAQGRFGARAMRAVLDHPGISAQQRRRAALAILLCAIPLACSSNGSILLHWLLDDTAGTFAAGHRFALVWTRLRPALPDLATHKLASHVLLRIGTQTYETQVAQDLCAAVFSTTPPGPDEPVPQPGPQDTADRTALGDAAPGSAPLVEAHPGSDTVSDGCDRYADTADGCYEEEAERLMYRDVILDQVHGSQLVAQLVCSPALSDVQTRRYKALARTVLRQHDLVHVPAHRKLAQAVGLAHDRATSS